MLGFFFGTILLTGMIGPEDATRLGYGFKNEALYYHSPPDPVNPKTLNFFLPVPILTLPCFQSIEINAAYNAYATESSLFGSKWTFNYNIHVISKGSRFEVMEGDGFANPYFRERNFEEAKNSIVENILIARKKQDSQSGAGLKSASVYEDLKKQLLNDAAFRDEQEAKYLGGARNLGAGKYYSLARGPSTLELKVDGTYERTFQNGAKEFFNKSGKIIRTVDRNGNWIQYAYLGENLSQVTDMCSRSVSFAYHQDKVLQNLVSLIKDSLGRTFQFDFYPDRRLKSLTDPQNIKTEYVYDKVGNMISITTITPPLKTNGAETPKKEIIRISYNDKGEVEKQSGPGDFETRFKRTFVANSLTHSITEISRYVSGKLDSKEVQEYKQREFEQITQYNSAGKEVKKEIKKISRETGYPISVLDGSGRGETYEYDSNTGNLMKRQTIPGQEVMQFTYDSRCNQVHTLKKTRPKEEPTETTFNFDAKCNLLEAKEVSKPLNASSSVKTPSPTPAAPTTGEKLKMWITIKYNPQGKIQFMTDNTNKNEIGFTFWKFGKPDSITLKDTGTLFVTYSPLGEIQKVDTFPHGKGKERFKSISKIVAQGQILNEVRSTLEGMLDFLKPAGLNIGL